MANVLYNNFISGQVSKKMAGRWDSQVYATGLEKAENVKFMMQGGVTRRWATQKIAQTGNSRLIPFVISSQESYLVELKPNGVFTIWDVDASHAENGVEPVKVNGATEFYTGYASDEIFDVQYTQDYSTLYLAHPSHPVLTITDGASSFEIGTFEPVVRRNALGSISEAEDNGLFTTPGNYPSVITYVSNRLWLGATNTHPYTLWASRPFEAHNFERFDIVEVVDDAATVEDYIIAIQRGDENPPSTPKTKTQDVIRADNAMKLEVGSDRSERIKWLIGGTNIIVGTASSEWIMSGAIDAIDQQIMMVSSYGSDSLKAEKCGTDILFLQSGRKNLMALISGNEGIGQQDLTLHCDDILRDGGGVKQLAWMRVPEPTLFCLLNDGTIAVLSYNRAYNINAWSKWSFNGNAKSIAVTDSPTGQELWAIVQRSDVCYLEKFNQVDALESQNYVFADWQNTVTKFNYPSEITTNRFETSIGGNSTLGKVKRATKMNLRLLNTEGYQSKVEGYDFNEWSNSSDIVELGDSNVYLGSSYEDTVQVSIRAIEDKPLTILATAVNMEFAQ